MWAILDLIVGDIGCNHKLYIGSNESDIENNQILYEYKYIARDFWTKRK